MSFDLDIQEINNPERRNNFNLKEEYVQQKKLNFRKTGTKKYRFTLEGEAMLHSMFSKTKVEYSWMLNVQQINDEFYILNIITYDNELKYSNEQGLQELFYVTNMFQKIYDDIKVKVDLNGKVLQVLNSDTLIDRWKRFKHESIKYFGTETNLEEYFAVTDEQFADPNFLKTLVSKSEFFFVYLQAGGYNRKFNSFSNYELIRSNAFEKGDIKWLISYSGKDQIASKSHIGEMKLDGSFVPNKKWLKDSYGELNFLDVDKLDAKFSIKGNYVFHNSNGWLKESVLDVNEIVDSKQLFHKLKYTIKEID